MVSIAPLPQQSYTGPAGEVDRNRMPLVPIQSYTGPAGLVNPAGDVPPNNYATGETSFRSNIHVVGAEPIVNAAAFFETLSRTVRQIMGDGVAVAAASIVKGAPGTVTVMRRRLTVLTPQSVLSYWINVDCKISASRSYELNGDAGLNRAIARAVAQVTTWTRVDTANGYRAPTDGGGLDYRFRRPDACTGGQDLDQVFAAACTRPVPRPAAPVAPRPTIDMQTGDASVPLRSCDVTLRATSHLRQTPTFTVGNSPSFPPGTRVTVIGEHVAQQGSLTLYPVLIGDQGGFMPLSVEEMAPCSTFRAPAPLAATRRASAVRATPSVPQNMQAVLAADTGPSAATIGWVALAAVGAFAVTAAVVKRKQIRNYFASRRKPNRRRHSSPRR